MTPPIPVIVGLGASAGGLEVLKQLFAILPNDTGLAFLVVMHLEPSRKSMLDQLLARETAMPVRMAGEGLAVLPNHVYICPPQQELTLHDGRLQLAEFPPAERYRPIDAVFRSLAGQGEQAIAVVLSGAGKDGSEGIKAVKAAGGLVLAQAEQTAAFPDMPRNAIATGVVDRVLSPEDIAHALMEAAQRLAPTDLEPGHREVAGNLTTILHLLRTKTGHDFSAYKENMIVRRIERRLVATGSTDFASYAACLANDPTEAQALSQDLLIGVTSFFRDPEAFAALHNEIFPGLFAGRGPDEPVRIWHASCSSGEEAYSMAILVREFLAENNLVTPVKMFATDIDETAIAQARRGFYSPAIAADLSPQRLRQFFVESDTGYQIAKPLREMIVFAPHSLIKDPPFSHLDLLVCRNFLIYLKPDMQRQLFTLFHLALKPGGWLFLGVSETVRPSSDLFELVDKRWKIYRRLAGGRQPAVTFPFVSSVARFAGPNLPGKSAGETPPTAGVVEKLLIERFVPPSVVVNPQYEVVHFPTGRTSRFLEAPIGEPTRDLLKLARPELRSSLRTAIHKTFADKHAVAFRGIILPGDPPLTVNVHVELLPAGQLALVQFETAPAPLPAPPTGGTPMDLPSDADMQEMLIRQLEEQLQVTQEQLQATIEQLETSNEGLMSNNEELLSINEEFQSTNEELHSTNEELETSREELQALNEELVTVNAELQQKVEELNQANSDMDNLLTSSEIATIFLDRELRIKRFTPAMARLFNLIPADCGRPFQHLSGIINWPDYDAEMAEVLAGEVPPEHEVTTPRGDHVFLTRALPYRTTTGQIGGVVATLIDITERKRLEERTRHLASFPEINPNPVMELDLAGTVTYFNPAIADILKNCSLDPGDATPLLPTDVPEVLGTWDSKTETKHAREVEIGGRSFAATVHLIPELQVARLYAYDITDRKQAHLAQLKTETKYRQALDTMLEGCQIIGFDWRYRYLNSAVEKQIHRPKAELLGRTMMECWPGISETRMFALAKDCMEKRSVHQMDNEFTFPDGRVGWFRLIIQPVPEGIAIYSEDITKRKRAEEALKESEEQFRIMFMRSSVGKAQADPHTGRFLRVNPALCRLTGYSEEELLERTFFEVTHPEDREADREKLKDLVSGKIDSFQSEKRYPRPDGNVAWGNVTVNLVRDEAGTPLRTLAVIQDITDRKQAEEALLASGERLMLAMTATELGIWDFDPVSGALNWDNRCKELFGLPADRTVDYETFLAGLHPEDRERTHQVVQKTFDPAGDGKFDIEYRTVGLEDGGVQRWVRATGQAFFAPSGEVTRFIGSVQDITERARGEQRLQMLAETASELLKTDSPQQLVELLCRRVMTILDCQAFFNFLVDEDSGRLHLNACAGIPEEEQRRIAWLDYGVAVCGCAARDACRIVAEDIAQTTDPRTELVKAYGIQSYACHPLMVQGRVLGTLSFGSRTRPRFNDDELALMAAVADHVAIAMERKLSEESLREREEIYRAIVSNAADGIVLVDPETLRMVEFNDAACASLGYSREEFADLSLADLHPDENDEELARRLEEGKLGDRNLDHFHRHKSGELRLVQVSSRHVTVRGKVFLASVWHDVTDRKRAEAEREKVDRLESLGVLAGGIAHDFNNILTAISGNISLARLKAGSGHPALAPLGASQNALQRATDLTRQLLTFSRGGEPVKKPLETGQLLDEILSFALHGSNSRGKLDLSDGLWPLFADPGQVHQALNNLIINAIQAMPDGGTLLLAATNAAVAEGQNPDLQAGRYLQISVSDQGCGIPAANLVKIFDPYFTTKPSGTGLGLASTFSIVKRHGGTIEVSSQPEQGTTFTLWLPAAEGPIPPRTAPLERQEPLPLAQPGMAVLVMDDEEMIRSLAAAMLDELGYQTVLCGDGAQAVAAYSEALERGKPFSAVILDMTVPGGMGGREAALKIHALDPAAVLVISTGYSVDATLDDTVETLFKGTVAKPYSLGRLARELARVTSGEAG